MSRGESKTERRERLRAFARQLPTQPGAYLFRDATGRIIYVGKAKSLRARVRSHFADPADLAPKARRTAEVTHSVDYVATTTEMEALLLEYNLIQEHRPRYNVTYRDDKSYPYIKVSLAETYPRIVPTRHMVDDGSRYFGPYADVGSMRRTLRLLGSLFPLPTCSLKLRVGMSERGCLDFFIGRCVGPCRGDVDPAEYRQIVEEAMDFLAGKKDGVIAGLEKQMMRASREQRFEEAAQLRDRLFSLRRTVAKQSVAVEGETETDALAFARLGRKAIGALLQVREGRVIGRERLEVGCTPNELDAEILRGLLLGFYEPKETFPKTILVPVLPEEQHLLSEWLSTKAGHPLRLKVPRRGDGKKILELAKHNAEVALGQEEPRSSASATRSLEALAQAIGLAGPPRRIEGVDISTIQGTDTYASLVVFLDGVKRPDEYRTYRIRDAPRRDDPRSIEEVVRRRAMRIAVQGSAPDLILVDGGPTQLDAAVRALRGAGLEIPVISLAKRFEETYLPGRPEPLRLPPTSEARLLLQRVRDEAHRFALKSHRRRRGTRLTLSALDEIAGIGARKKKLLLERFGSVEAMKRSRIDELAQVPGIGRTLALAIWTHLGGAEET
jgi:excinuclease ABC subunit C